MVNTAEKQKFNYRKGLKVYQEAWSEASSEENWTSAPKTKLRVYIKSEHTEIIDDKKELMALQDFLVYLKGKSSVRDRFADIFLFPMLVALLLYEKLANSIYLLAIALLISVLGEIVCLRRVSIKRCYFEDYISILSEFIDKC